MHVIMQPMHVLAVEPIHGVNWMSDSGIVSSVSSTILRNTKAFMHVQVVEDVIVDVQERST